jgi:hypothetical protein
MTVVAIKANELFLLKELSVKEFDTFDFFGHGESPRF